MRMRAILGVALLLAPGALCAPAEAQQMTVGGTANIALPPRQLTRGKLWQSFINTGAEGARLVEINYGGLYADVAYPGMIIAGGNDYVEHYGGATDWTDFQTDLMTHQGRGHGWYIAAKVDGTPAVSFGDALIKGKEESDDIIAMAFDPTVDLGGRFANLGNEVINPRSGRSMGNWWPGTTIPLDASEPREILNYRIGQYTDASVDNFPEDIILSKWTTKTGITGNKAAYAWNHPDYDDFIIVEWVFENTGDTDGDRMADLPGGGHNLENVYFAFHHRFMTSGAGTSRSSYVAYYWDWGPLDGCVSIFGANVDNGQDDKIKYTESPNYDGPTDARGLKLTYQYDWDNFCYTGSFADDVGDPFRVGNRSRSVSPPAITQDGDLLSPAWIGWTEIDVDPTDGFIGDNEVYVAPDVVQQPFAHNLFHFQYRQQNVQVHSDLRGEEPNPTEMSDETMYQMLTRSPDPSYFEPLNSHAAATTRPTRASGDPNLGVPLLPLPDNPTGPMPYVPDPEWEWVGRNGVAAAYTPMDTYGPYDMAPGDKVKLVFAYVAGAPVTENVRKWQRAGDNSELRKEENGAAWANLVNHVKRAKEAYALGYDLPNQPPDVDVKLESSTNAQVLATWKGDLEKSNNPDAGQPDVAGYRVYRAETIPDEWVLAGDVKANGSATYEFEDPQSLAGFRYYYSVRSYQGSANTGFVSRVTGQTVAGGVSAYESGAGDPSTFYLAPTGMTPFSPAQVASTEADRLEKDILIVPNPYIEDGLHTYEASTKIRILNIPRRCKIRIYNFAGDLVAEVDHDSATEGEAAYFQLNRTATSPLIFGTYLVAVESLMPESRGQVKRGAFVVIR